MYRYNSFVFNLLPELSAYNTMSEFLSGQHTYTCHLLPCSYPRNDLPLTVSFNILRPRILVELVGFKKKDDKMESNKDLIVVEYLKIYFSTHPEKVPADADKAFELFQQMHKKYKLKILGEFKQKSEKYVDRFFDDKDTKYY